MIDSRSSVPAGADETEEEGVVTPLEDGGVLVDFAVEDEQALDLSARQNLAEAMDRTERQRLASMLAEAIKRDEESRAERVERWKEILKIVGLEKDDSEGPFEGASRAVDSLTLEVAMRFHARALAEMAPASGPIRTQIMGAPSDDVEAQAMRVKDRLNYWATEEAPEWLDDHDKLLLYVGFMGSMFKKTWFDHELNRPTSRLVWPDAVIVDYHARDIDDALRVTHAVPPMSRAKLRWMQDAGLYLDDDLGEPEPTSAEGMREVADRVDGRETDTSGEDQPYELYECHTSLDLSEYLPGADEGERPYIVTLTRGGDSKLLAVHRNWSEHDGKRKDWFTHYWLYPGPGFYGLGFYDILGRIQDASTGSLRALFDSAAFANLQGGFVSESFKADKSTFRMSPGLFKQVPMSSEDLSKSFVIPPFKEPSPVLNDLRQQIREDGRRIGAITDMAVGDVTTGDVPVGTMMAALEQSSQPTSALHLRLCRSMRREFRIVARLMGEYMPDEYPYKIAGDDKVSLRADFDDRVDVVPVADPTAPTQTHRVNMAQMKLQVIGSAPPGMFDVRQAYRDVMVSLDPDGADRLIPERDDAPSLDPVSENIRLMAGRPVRATVTQDHDAHMAAHGAILQLVGSMPAMGPMAPVVQQSIAAHMAEHMAHKYAVMVAAQLGLDPNIFVTEGEEDESGIPPELEGMIAKPAADATAAFVQQVIQAMGGGQQGQGDPAMLLAQAELEKAQAQKMGAEARMKSAELAELDSQRDFAVARAKLQQDAGIKLETIRSGERKTAAQIEAKGIN